MRFTESRISFTAVGTELTAFRRALREAGIRCRNQQMRGGCLSAETRSRDRAALEAIAAAQGIALEITQERGLRRLLRPYKMRLGLLCGLLLGLGLMYWCNAYVRTVEIRGNSSISGEEILTALEALGVSGGTPIREIPFTFVEQRMKLAVSDIEQIHLRHSGGRLIVEISEERPHPPITHPHLAANYIAALSAQITDIRVLGGHAACKVGDAVKPGDLLISGTDVDKFGITHYYRGDGIVTGIYEADFTAEQPFCTEIPVRGRTETQTVLSLMGKRIPLTPSVSMADAGIIYEEDPVPLTLFGRTLPIALLHCHSTEQATAITVFSEAEAKALLEESAARFERNFHAEDRILSREVSFQQSDLGISLQIHYVFEGVIGKLSEFFVKLS